MSADVKYTDKGATMSACGRYRYLLWREWRGGTYDPNNWRKLGAKDAAGREMREPKACVFIMLNPSTADCEADDPTIRRCVGFANAWNFSRLEVVNLFSYRASKPKVLLALTHDDDPVGVQNQGYIERATSDAGSTVCAWGTHGGHLGQDETVLGWVLCSRLYSLGTTQDGHPRHPLYVPALQPLQPFARGV